VKQFSFEEAAQEGLVNTSELAIQQQQQQQQQQHDIHDNDDENEEENKEENERQTYVKKMSKPKKSEYSVVR